MPTQTPVKPVTLSTVANVARKSILVGGITLAVVIVGRFALESFVTFWVRTHPAPPPPPTTGFGVLPQITFPTAKAVPTSYKLEVSARQLTFTQDRAPVFFMPTQRASLLSLSKAKGEANSLGFILEPEPVTSSVYRWSRNQPLLSTLEYNISNGTFTQTLDWQSDPTFLQQKNLPTEDEAIRMTRSLLSSAGKLEDDVATSSAKITYLKSTPGGYEEAVSLSESDFLQVDIFRDKIGSRYDVVMDDPTHGAIRAIISGHPDDTMRFVSIAYKYLPIQYNVFETYPIISPENAFDLLKSGKGYTARMPKDQKDVTIRNIRLGFFDGFTPSSYVQPIYILEGDGGYTGYVPAITPLWLQ